jgi:inorganic pyrophosphatase
MDNKLYKNNIVDVQIEIAYGQSVKYEINHETHELRVDRFLHGPFAYPFNYGYIINTLGGDGDPLDAVVICKQSLIPTAYIKCRIIGALITSDENGPDEKILLVPDIKIDPYNKNINTYLDIDEHTLDEIKYFFEHYKDLEKNKFTKIGKFVSADEAIQIYVKSLLR